MIIYETEIIQQKTRRGSVDIIAAILKVVLRGEGTKRGIGGGSNLTLRQIRQYLHLLLEYDLLHFESREKETIYKIIQKTIHFLNLHDQLNSMIQHTKGADGTKIFYVIEYASR
jgi:predicted transcriptional regulator